MQDLKERDYGLTGMVDEISGHKRALDELEEKIPTSIAVGAFWINCSKTRDHLMSKRSELLQRCSELLASVPRGITTKAIRR